MLTVSSLYQTGYRFATACTALMRRRGMRIIEKSCMAGSRLNSSMKWVRACLVLCIVISPGCAGVAQDRPTNAAESGFQFSSDDHGGAEGMMREMRRWRPMPKFKLMDQHGEPITQEQMRGKWTILFFGYTHCPDYCPTTLMALKIATQRLIAENPKLGDRLQVILVSLDPFRDTPAVLTDYLAYFNPQFIGASGAPGELKRFSRLLGGRYDYTDIDSGAPLGDTDSRPPGEYAVSHNADFYVFDDRTRLVNWVEPPHTTQRVTAALEGILKQYGGW